MAFIHQIILSLCIWITLFSHSTQTEFDSQEIIDSNNGQDTNHNFKDSNEERLVKSEVTDDEVQLKHRLEIVDKLDSSLLTKFDLSSPDWKAEGSATTLRQVLFIHRHGDRTPVTFPSRDELAKEPFWNFHGLGQLTNRGKARLFLLGRMIRARYDKFLKESVNKNRRISRSSGALRCIESAQVFLAGFLALNTNNSIDSKQLIWDNNPNELSHLWQPASIQSVPAHLDGMLAESAVCNALDEEYNEVIDKMEFVKELNEEFKEVAETLDRSIGYKIDRFDKWSWASSLIAIESSYFSEKMNPDILEVYDRLQKAGELSSNAYVHTFKSRQLRGGLLLKDIINNMKALRASVNNKLSDKESQEVKNFVHYSGHDLNLIVLLSMFGNLINHPKVPDFASNIAIELHEANNQWFVRIFYMQSVPEKPIEIFLSGCQENNQEESAEGFGQARKGLGGIIELFGSRKRVKKDNQYAKMCTLDGFERLVKPYLIDDWETWMKMCRNKMSQMNPYRPGH